jgi:hypothetical protein
MTNLFERVLTQLGLQVRVADDPGWTAIARAGLGPADRNWPDMLRDLEDTMEMWRDNFLVRQVVRLTTAYVVGDGITVSSSHPWVSGWLQEFWTDKQNRIDDRLPEWCNELTRSGELYLALFPNRVSGMQYVRALPATCIEQVICDPEDYEKETGYLERVPGQLEPRYWKSKLTAAPDEPVLLHFAINRPVGATRGESDLTPVLPWAKRYSEFLTERARFNRIRNELAMMHIEVQDESKVEAKRRQYASTPPTGGSILVTGPGEKVDFPSANIQGYDAAPDGKAMRLAFAAGANIPLHFLSEGSDSNRNTAAEMGDPTHRHFQMRQQQFKASLRELVEVAYWRAAARLGPEARQPEDLRLEVEAPDVSRDDNRIFASAASGIVSTLAMMKAQGWVTDEYAIRIAYKFMGEVIDEETLEALLAAAVPAGDGMTTDSISRKGAKDAEEEKDSE